MVDLGTDALTIRYIASHGPPNGDVKWESLDDSSLVTLGKESDFQ